MTNRARNSLQSDPATGAALRRAGYVKSAAAVGVVALLLAAASGAGFGGKEPAQAVDQPAVEGRAAPTQDRLAAPARGFQDEFQLDPRELQDYRSNVHG